ncbi:hypothetical protein B0H19DRAFT_1370971 [Mycena capillaripes]|nr:hypothetical protein B0H19DRAFT_1370971 [Mycena capillaripes]
MSLCRENHFSFPLRVCTGTFYSALHVACFPLSFAQYRELWPRYAALRHFISPSFNTNVFSSSPDSALDLDNASSSKDDTTPSFLSILLRPLARYTGHDFPSHTSPESELLPNNLGRADVMIGTYIHAFHFTFYAPTPFFSIQPSSILEGAAAPNVGGSVEGLLRIQPESGAAPSSRILRVLHL